MISPFRRGHRDAAQGIEQNPFDFKLMPSSHDAWINAHARVDVHRKNGLDPSGHAPQIPHLCERTVSATSPAKVCNCCSTCSTQCWAEQFDGTTERIRSTVGGLLRKIGLRR